MNPAIRGIEMTPLAGAVPAWRATVDASARLSACEAIARSGGRLGALWASDERERGAGFTLRALLVAYEGLDCLELAVPAGTPDYPDLSAIFPCATRMQRAARDLLGVRAASAGPGDARGWLRHGAWRDDAYPLRRDVPLAARLPEGDTRYASVTVEGDGVHELAEIPRRPSPAHLARWDIRSSSTLRKYLTQGWTPRRFDSADQATRNLCLLHCGR